MADPPTSPGGGQPAGNGTVAQGTHAKAVGAVVGRLTSTFIKLVTAFERLDRIEAKLSATTEKLEVRLRALEDRVLLLERDTQHLVGRATAEARERGAEAAMQHLTALSDRVTRLEAERRPRRVASSNSRGEGK